MKRCAFFLLFSVIISGCTSLPEPSDKKSTMVIGKIILAAKGFDGYGHVNVNGISKTGITIIIEEIKTGKTYTVTSVKNGFFHFVDLPAGEYFISKCYYKYASGNAWAEIYSMPGNGSNFNVLSGKVNNLGAIYWFADKKYGTTYQYNKEHSSVQDDFNLSYKSSLWLNYEWIITSIGQKNYKPQTV